MPPKRGKKMSFRELMEMPETRSVVSTRTQTMQPTEEDVWAVQVEMMETSTSTYTQSTTGTVIDKAHVSYLKAQVAKLEALVKNQETEKEALKKKLDIVKTSEIQLQKNYTELSERFAKEVQSHMTHDHTFFELQKKISVIEEKLKVSQKEASYQTRQYEYLTEQYNYLNNLYEQVSLENVRLRANIRGVWQRQIEHSFSCFDKMCVENRVHSRTSDSFMCPICMTNQSNVLLKCTNTKSASSGHMICHECLMMYRQPVVNPQPRTREYNDFDSESDYDFDDGHPGVSSTTDMNCPLCRRKVQDIIVMH